MGEKIRKPDNVVVSCGYLWEEAGEPHWCGVRGSHTTHVCEDDVGCAITVSVDAGGGRNKTGRAPKWMEYGERGRVREKRRTAIKERATQATQAG